MRSEAWRPATAACNRSPREAREVARQALRPGCEELAARIRVMPETEARPRVKNRHGGAPRGERPASWDARRLARRLAYRVMIRPTGVPPSTRTFLGAPRTSRVKLLTLLQVPIWLRGKTYTSTYLSLSLYIFFSKHYWGHRGHRG